MKLLQAIFLPFMSLWLVIAFGGIPVFEAYCKPEACKQDMLQAGCCSKPVEAPNCNGITIGWTNAVAGCCSITGTYLQLLVPAKPVTADYTLADKQTAPGQFASIPITAPSASEGSFAGIFHPPPPILQAHLVCNPHRILRL